MGNVPGNAAGGYERTSADDGSSYPGTPRNNSSRGASGVGGASQTLSSSVPSAQGEQEGGANASRSERAAALEAKLSKKRPKPKDLAAVKDAHWKRYNELERGGVEPVPSSSAAAAAPYAMPDTGYRLSDSAVVRTSAAASAAPPAPSAPAAAPAAVSPAAAAAASSQVLSGQKRYESAEEAAVRAQRAAVFAKPDAKKREKELNARDEKWKAYSQFDAAAAAKPTGDQSMIVNAPLPFGFPSSSPTPSAPFSPLPYAAASSASAAPSAAAPAAARPALQVNHGSSSSSPSAPLPDYFLQQMEYLTAKIRLMPPSSVSLLRTILKNLIRGGDDPTPDDLKFRKIKLANPKIQAVVRTDGAMELLQACGFVEKQMMSAADMGAVESFLVFPEGGALDIAQLAYQELAVFSPTSG